MAPPGRVALFGRRFIRHVARLVAVFWRSAEARVAALLLAGAVALEIATVYGTLQLSDAERRILDALEDRQPAAFGAAMLLFAAIATGFAFVSAYRVYVRQLVEIRWRRSVTAYYVDRWVSGRAYCQAQLHGDEVDNPDQRIAEDVREFAASALGLSLSLLAALATLFFFGGLLWRLSGVWALPLDGVGLRVPGSLLWVILVYAALSTWLTHVVGRRLVPLNVERLRYEADFRYGLMRFRDNVEVVTLSRGDALERRGALARFANVMRNWWQLIAAQRRLTVFTGVIGQANNAVPLLIAAPGFFAGLISLGTVVQIRIAYGQVSGALNWFVNAYQEIARWRANVERLSTFSEVMDATDRDLAQSRIQVEASTTPALRLTDVRLQTYSGELLIDTVNATVSAGDRVAITGPSGAGKTVLLRAIAGIWPFGSGRIEVPGGARMLFVPQWPYMPLSSLRAVVSYPAQEGTFADDRICEILCQLGLERLSAHLDETAPWDQHLSPHEQQRLAIARVLLNEPEWVFLDKATSALDEAMEQRVYELIAARLPRATVVSVANRSALAAYHSRHWTITPKDHGPSSLQVAWAPTAAT